MTTATVIAGMLTRELRALRRELEAYENEGDIWRLAPPIANSAGTLALHLAGNLRHYVGAQWGGTGYVRDRDAEFRDRGISRRELLSRVDAAIGEVEQALSGVTDAQLAAPFPEPIARMTVNSGEFLIHLAAHAAYHLGQVDYHRRLLTGSTATVGAVSPAELRSATPA
jgi:uncharacterized damage-inducible protein DinB